MHLCRHHPRQEVAVHEFCEELLHFRREAWQKESLAMFVGLAIVLNFRKPCPLYGSYLLDSIESW